ncbi:GIY-YIG nuclease family protein [Streptomyces yanii]
MANRTSTQNLRTRVRYHYRGNAAGSTLRLTLGCLLGLELRRVGSGKR